MSCPVRRHNRRDDLWRQCWHDLDRGFAHARSDHRWCLPGDALPLPDADPYGLDTDQGDDPDRCRWAARWNYELRRNTNKTDVGRTFCHRAVA